MHATQTPMMALTAVVALSIASTAAASPLPNNGAAAAARQAAVGAQPLGATSVAKLAVLYSPASGIIRSRDVSNVYSPGLGLYCITPIHAVKQGKVYQSVTVDWGWSSGSSLVAMARDTADGFTDCAADEFEVMTFDLTGAPSGGVGFFLEVL